MDFDEIFCSLETNLKKHKCMHLDQNPVLVGLDGGTISGDHGVWVLGQYCFFPARIVEILSAMAFKLFAWPKFHAELLENVAEECGAKTGGVPNIKILTDCVRKELGVNVSQGKIGDSTKKFLDGLVDSVHSASRAFVAGMAYALEDSALPELEVVAEVVNQVLNCRHDKEHRIHSHLSRDRDYARSLMKDKSPSDYTLEDFFAIHLLDIEIDHRDDLKNAIRLELDPAEVGVELQRGFEFVLSAMEDWWTALAEHSNVPENFVG